RMLARMGPLKKAVLRAFLPQRVSDRVGDAAEAVSLRSTPRGIIERLAADGADNRCQGSPSQHPRQIGADRAARIAVAARLFALAVGGNVRGERNHLLVSTVPRDQVGEPIPA